MQIFCYSKFVSPLSDQIIQNFTAFYYFNLCSSAIEVYLSRYNSKWDRERRVNSTLSDHFGLENFNCTTLAIIPFWMKFNFFEQKQMQSPPWLSRWRVRRVLIHMRRAKNGTYWNWLRVTKNVTKLRRDESTLQSWDPEFNPYW